jgi:hypothetical protein
MDGALLILIIRRPRFRQTGEVFVKQRKSRALFLPESEQNVISITCSMGVVHNLLMLPVLHRAILVSSRKGRNFSGALLP